ncbi:proline dehydrogenase family protein [Rubrivirga sp. S365]|uniref:proline dehydrogenase n=1 Tax=Rubrivirga litoralis TaxID=3075598 RepID=A0ABU3BQT5_9BACT|nr:MULTISPECIES: proline dehydrogenase family protein [unclassified Rubrivirga]MDT0631643.1 proline dehydrogenase family protein [Rubrivirga sp. F394]MDT7855614.1 proline dehydrogenase family protein [Rubrivirga sp. S365]
MKLPFALARRFVAGETLDAALPALGALLDDGLFVTLDLLGEHVADRDRAGAAADAYADLVGRLAGLRDERGVPADAVGISIKLSMLGQVIDRDLCEQNLREVLTSARDADLFVRLDMEGSDLTQSTLDLFEAVYPDFPDHVGPVLQAYLHRTDADVARMVELQARVRLCKGAYGEPASIAYQDMPTIRWHFRRLARTLLDDGRYPGIATHDDQLIEAVRQHVEQHDIDRDAFEFQMLYGLRPETQRQIVRDGYRMRVYVPYGTEWLPYYSRRLRERRENVTFILRNLVRA